MKTWTEVKKRIASFADLEENWDSYGAIPIAPDAIAKLSDLATALEADGFPVGFPQPINSGWCSLVWFLNGAGEAEIETTVNGFEWWIWTPGKPMEQQDEGDIHEARQWAAENLMTKLAPLGDDE